MDTTSNPALRFADPLNLGLTVGVGYIGVAISSILYGVTCSQTFNYYRSQRCKRDRWFLKSLVAAVWILDSAHQALIIHIFYFYLVLNYANPAAILINVWSVPLGIMLTVIVAVMVQTFLALRVWRFTRNIRIAGLCAFWIILEFGVDLAFAIKDLLNSHILQAEKNMLSIGAAALSVAVICDACIAIVMTSYLYKSRTGFRRSDDMLTKLMALTISTGALTTCFALANLITFLAAPFSFIDIFFNMMLSKLHSISLLTVLNTREIVLGTKQETKTDKIINSFPLSVLRFAADPEVDDTSNPLAINNVTSQAPWLSKQYSLSASVEQTSTYRMSTDHVEDTALHSRFSSDGK